MRRWSGVRAATLLGVEIVVDPLIVVFAALYAYAGSLRQWAIVFVCLVVHEMSHAIAAAGFGLAVDAVEITPIGAVARIGDGLEHDPGVEAAVAMAGPMTSLVLAAAGYLTATYGNLEVATAEFFIGANLALALFNLIPALPLDGGRVFRALLSERIGHVRATRRAAALSRIIAAAVTVLGTLGAARGRLNLVVPALGLFLLVESGREEQSVMYVGLRSGIRKRAAFETGGAALAKTLAVSADVPASSILSYFTGPEMVIISVIGHNGAEIGRLSEFEFMSRVTSALPQATVGNLLSCAGRP